MRFVLRATQPERAPHMEATPARLTVTARPMRVLDFDLENRPLSYLGSDFTTAEITAIAWAWVDRPKDVTALLLGEIDYPDMLAAFVHAYNQADLVTGHFIVGHDLPMLNGALLEMGMTPLSDKLVQDTKVHLVRAKGVSRSQESLGAMLELEQSKVQMNQAKWRAANRLTPEGLDQVRERVTGDVRQHIELRQQLLARGYLRPPRIWRSQSAPMETYAP